MRRLLDLQPFDTDRQTEPTPLRARIARDGTVLSLQYVLRDPTDRWRLAEPRAAPARADRLWERTCFEAFLAPEDSAAYWEINLASNGDWNVYRFDGYRRGMRIEEQAPTPVVRATGSTREITIAATLDLTSLVTIASSRLDVGLTAVLESREGALSYWALQHAPGRPDFHRRETFVERLAAEEHA